MRYFKPLIAAFVFGWLFWLSNEMLTQIGLWRLTKESEINMNRYEVDHIGGGELSIPIILDKASGKVWKYFQNDDGTKGFHEMPFYREK